MTVTLNLRPEEEAGLLSRAQALGTTVEHYVQQLITRDLPREAQEPASERSGLVDEDGLLIYRNGNPLPTHVVNEAVSNARETRAKQILGDFA